MKNKKLYKAICLGLSIVMTLLPAGCGRKAADTADAFVIDQDNQEEILTEILNSQVSPSHSSEAGKEETVYVIADASGKADQIIVSDWLKNADGGNILKDSSDLTDIQNVKGYESFEKDKNGNITWQAQGSDIYYRGTSDKEVPVEVKVSYKLDGRDITPEEIAGKSGKVTIRMDYINKETKKVRIGGKEEEINIPFAMISGMVLPQDIFTNIEVTNAKLMSEGENNIVIGLAFPGLKESIAFEDLKDKVSDKEAGEKINDMEIPDYIEVTADARNFKLDMTMTVAMSDILSDIELTDSIDLSRLTDSMDELKDAAGQLKDGTKELNDGSGKLKDGTDELLAGAGELSDGALELKDGTQELYEKSGLLDDGAGTLYDGIHQLNDGTLQLQNGGQSLVEGTASLVSGTQSLNDGAHQIKNGVDEVAGEMNFLRASVGTQVTSMAGVDPENPATLLQASYLLNQSLKKAVGGEDKYNYILQQMAARKQTAQDNLGTAQANLSEAQERVLQTRAELEQAGQPGYEEVQVVTGTHTETENKDVEMEAADDTGETVTQTVEMEKEVVDTDTIQIQSVDTDNLQQKMENYQAAVETAAACQAEVSAYAAEIEVLDAEIEVMANEAAQAVDPMAMAVSYAYGLDQQLVKLSEALNNTETLNKMSMLVNGAGSLADGTQEALNGAKALNDGAGQLKSGIDTLNSGAGELADGAATLKDGTQRLVEGTGTLNDGADSLTDGIAALRDGVITLDEGVGTLDEGTLELMDGMFEFDEEGISKLTDLFGDNVQDAVDRLKAVADAGKDYNTFTGVPEGVKGSVKFIIKTAAVKNP